MARPPFTFDRNTLGSNGSFLLRFMAGSPFAPLTPHNLVSLLKGAFALTVFALLFLFPGILLHIVSRIRWSSLPDAFLVGYAVACRCADTGSTRGLCPA